MTFNLLFPLLSSSFLYDNVKILQIRFRKQYLMLLRVYRDRENSTHIFRYTNIPFWLLKFSGHSIQSEIVLSSSKKLFASPSSCTNPSMAVCVLTGVPLSICMMYIYTQRLCAHTYSSLLLVLSENFITFCFVYLLFKLFLPNNN